MSRYNYFDEVSVTSTSFPVAADAVFGFHSTGLSLLNRGSVVVEYSFDGVTVHGDLNPSDASAGATFDNRTECKVWLRLASAGSAAVRVEAWGQHGR